VSGTILTKQELIEIVKDLSKFEEKLKNIKELLDNHLSTHSRRETALIIIIGSLAMSLMGLVVKLFIGS